MTPVSPPIKVRGKEIRKELSRVLVQVGDGQHVLITHHDRPVAAIIPIEDYYRLPPQPQEGDMQVISIYNQAGGAGKTTVTRDLGYALTNRGYRVLLIDLDAQASLTRWLGLLTPTQDQPKPPASRLDRTVFSVISDPEADLPTPLRAFGMDVVPANSKLSAGDALLYDDRQRMDYLRRAIHSLKGRYDIVLLDAPPGRTSMALAAVAASDHMIIPVNASKALENINNVAEVLRDARLYAPNLNVLAFVPHSINTAQNHDKDILRYLNDELSALAPSTTPITFKNVLYKDASMAQEPIAVFAPKHSPKAEYDVLASEILQMLNLASKLEAGV
ncbi:type II toxin-antitoxin system prevent-host-death family antitoxin [Deinococcus sp. Leaf326]|uniref:type II toxin-antitoxin system prevent-host-death family antitoxin n=1 Tax=Deinococcus sp. Leaf326 TaxID=1736338 RepID=UPI0009EA8431|nr:type II toxin-antitoxin system prevent-host-death family antitoxin [Deinococcus sp. Leaf326]